MPTFGVVERQQKDRFCPILPSVLIAVKSPAQFPGTLEPLEILMKLFVRRSLMVLVLALLVARCSDQPTAVKAPAAPLALRWAQAPQFTARSDARARSEEHTSELQSPCNLVCRLLLEKKKKK